MKTTKNTTTVKSTRKRSTAKTITNYQNPKIMETKTESTQNETKKPIAKRVYSTKRVIKESVKAESIIDASPNEGNNLEIGNLDNLDFENKPKESLETLYEKKLFNHAMHLILRDEDIAVAKVEIGLIEKAFSHIRLSSRYYGFPSEELFGFYGYIEGTPHYEAIREIKLTEEERIKMPWRYRDREKKSKNLERYIALTNHYFANVVSHYPDIEQPMGLLHLAELIAIAKLHLVYEPKVYTKS